MDGEKGGGIHRGTGQCYSDKDEERQGKCRDTNTSGESRARMRDELFLHRSVICDIFLFLYQHDVENPRTKSFPLFQPTNDP